MFVPVGVRIAMIVAGFGVLFGAEFVDAWLVRRRLWESSRRFGERGTDSRVVGIRIAGGLLIVAGVVVWYLARSRNG